MERPPQALLQEKPLVVALHVAGRQPGDDDPLVVALALGRPRLGRLRGRRRPGGQRRPLLTRYLMLRMRMTQLQTLVLLVSGNRRGEGRIGRCLLARALRSTHAAAFTVTVTLTLRNYINTKFIFSFLVVYQCLRGRRLRLHLRQPCFGFFPSLQLGLPLSLRLSGRPHLRALLRSRRGGVRIRIHFHVSLRLPLLRVGIKFFLGALDVPSQMKLKPIIVIVI